MARRPQRARGRAARWGTALGPLFKPPKPLRVARPARGPRSPAARTPPSQPRAFRPLTPAPPAPGCSPAPASAPGGPAPGSRSPASAEDARPGADRLPATLGLKAVGRGLPWRPTRQGWGTRQRRGPSVKPRAAFEPVPPGLWALGRACLQGPSSRRSQSFPQIPSVSDIFPPSPHTKLPSCNFEM